MTKKKINKMTQCNTKKDHKPAPRTLTVQANTGAAAKTNANLGSSACKGSNTTMTTATINTNVFQGAA